MPIVFIGLAIPPHFMLWKISETQKQETLQELESKPVNLYAEFSKNSQGFSPNLSDLFSRKRG